MSRILHASLPKIAIVALLTLQSSGAHLHAATGEHEHASDHGLHLVSELFSEHSVHDHDDHEDVKIIAFSHPLKSFDGQAIAPSTPTVSNHEFIKTRWLLPPSKAPPPQCDLRLRPPLRAPPILI